MTGLAWLALAYVVLCVVLFVRGVKRAISDGDREDGDASVA